MMRASITASVAALWRILILIVAIVAPGGILLLPVLIADARRRSRKR